MERFGVHGNCQHRERTSPGRRGSPRRRGTAEQLRRGADDALVRMVDQIEARLSMLRMTAGDRLAAEVDVDAVLRYTALAQRAGADEMIGYRMLVAEKPADAEPEDTCCG